MRINHKIHVNRLTSFNIELQNKCFMYGWMGGHQTLTCMSTLGILFNVKIMVNSEIFVTHKSE